MSEPERPKRLSLSAIVELLLTRSTTDRSGVVLTRNAKGDTQIEVVVRTGDEFPTIGDAALKARALYDVLAAEYPHAGTDGHAGSAVELTRNAKGETQIDVSVKTVDGASASTIEAAEQKAADVYERMRARFPLASGYVGVAPEPDKPTKPAAKEKGGA